MAMRRGAGPCQMFLLSQVKSTAACVAGNARKRAGSVRWRRLGSAYAFDRVVLAFDTRAVWAVDLRPGATAPDIFAVAALYFRMFGAMDGHVVWRMRRRS